MLPSETSKHADLLEHPDEAFAFYRSEGIQTVICEQKHMGSRAVVIVCKEESVVQSRFGVLKPSLGVVYTRTGRRFFQEEGVRRTVPQPHSTGRGESRSMGRIGNRLALPGLRTDAIVREGAGTAPRSVCSGGCLRRAVAACRAGRSRKSLVCPIFCAVGRVSVAQL